MAMRQRLMDQRRASREQRMVRWHSGGFLAAWAAILLTVMIRPCFAQSEREAVPHAHDTARTGAQAGNPVILADGASNPSAIPDEIAFLHFFGFLAKNPHAVDQHADELRRISYVNFFFTKKPCGLSPQEDRSLTDAERTALLDYADRVGTNIVALGPSGGFDASRRNEAVLAGIAGLDAALGPNVAQKVRSHVSQHMKPLIKIVQSQIGPSDR